MKTIQDIGDDTIITYMRDFLPSEEANNLFLYLRDNLEWRQDIFKIGSKEVLVPRLTSFQAAKGVKYRYAGLTQESEGFDAALIPLTESVEKEANNKFNSILLNYYRDARDSISAHSDSEKELGSNPVVAAISLGGKRRFDLVNKKDTFTHVSFEVENGSLLIMGSNCQNNWKHKIDKYTGSDPRISLTFRFIQ